MTTTPTAIPTLFRGIEYRSRLEARWAAFFDEIGWEYTYEPLDGAGYIPDFLIHGAQPLLVEIKPAIAEDDYRAPVPKVMTGLDGRWEHDILILGVSPIVPGGEHVKCMCPLGVSAGWFGSRNPRRPQWEFELCTWWRINTAGQVIIAGEVGLPLITRATKTAVP